MATRIDYWLSDNGEHYPTEEDALLADKIFQVEKTITEGFKYDKDDFDDLTHIISEILEEYDIIPKSKES